MNSARVNILHHLQKRERLRKMTAYAGIAFGLPLTLLGPLILGTMFWFSNLMLFSYLPWSFFFVGSALIAIPSLFIVEKRTKGGFIDDIQSNSMIGLPGGEEFSQRMLVYGLLPSVAASVITHPRVATAGFVELFLFGPRLVLNGLDHLRKSRRIPELNREMACNVLEKLLGRDSGMTIDEIGGNKRDELQLGCTILWLAYYEWVDVSKDHDKLFIYSDARKTLAN